MLSDSRVCRISFAICESLVGELKWRIRLVAETQHFPVRQPEFSSEYSRDGDETKKRLSRFRAPQNDVEIVSLVSFSNRIRSRQEAAPRESRAMSFFRRDSGRETSAPGRDDYETAFEDPSEGDALILNPASLTPHSSGHPAQRNEAERRNTTEFEESASERTERVPGGYDFEQQITDGAPALSSNREESTRPSPSHPISTSALGLAASSYRRALSLRERVIPAALYARLGFAPVASSTEGTGLLFSQDADDEDEDDSRSSAYPPRSGNSHLPLPVRPPAFAPPRSTNNGGRVFGGGQGNDGVFANLSAKPDRTTGNGAEYVGGEDGNGDDEVLPVRRDFVFQGWTRADGLVC